MKAYCLSFYTRTGNIFMFPVLVFFTFTKFKDNYQKSFGNQNKVGLLLLVQGNWLTY